jgi:hypothetical protein
MGLLQWFQTRRPPARDPRLTAWHSAWEAAVAAVSHLIANPPAVGVLTRDLTAFGLPGEEIEIEQEMLAGLEELLGLIESVKANGLPLVVTGHRVVGEERCHLSAPASMPEEPSQPSGTLLLTSGAAVFAGAGVTRRLTWHRVAEVLHVDRDLVLLRRNGEPLYRFRCNGFSDVLRASFVARELQRATASRPAGL